VIFGACSVSDFGGIDHLIQHKPKFDPGPTKRHMNNREFLMTTACFFLAAGRFDVGGLVLRKHDMAAISSMPTGSDCGAFKANHHFLRHKYEHV
jgi:hypothetical protein